MTVGAHGIIDDNGEHACWGIDEDGVIWVRPVEDVHLPDSDVAVTDDTQLTEQQPPPTHPFTVAGAFIAAYLVMLVLTAGPWWWLL